MRLFTVAATALAANGIRAEEGSDAPPPLVNEKDPRFFFGGCGFFGMFGCAPATQAPTPAPTPKPTTKAPTTASTRAQCAFADQVQYFNNAQFGWGNMIHGCSFTKLEDCMQACVDKTECKGFTFDKPPAQYSNNCFLFSKVGENWTENTDPSKGWVSGFRCDNQPPVMPTGPPTVTSWSNWTPTAAPTPPPPPPPPTCADKTTVLCRAYGDPHYYTLDGKFINNQSKGFKLLSQYAGRQLPKYKIVTHTKSMWWFNPWVSMTEFITVNFESQTSGTSWSIKFYLGGWGSVRSQIVYTHADGRRNTVSGNNEWNHGDFNYVCMRGQACVTTWFGLKICYASKKWHAQVWVPKCYKNKGIIGACGNFNGNQWDDGAVPGSSPIRLRREPQVPVESLLPGAHKRKRSTDIQDPALIVEKAFDPTTLETKKATCNQDYDTIFSGCDKVSYEAAWAVCYDTLKTTGFIETCIFDSCSENETDMCETYATYAATCAAENSDKLTKDDSFCSWAEDYGCVPECGANSHWEGCVDECREIKTCGTLSPVPKDCPETKYVSMCVCDDGFVMMDDECVPESQCGCTTEEGATIPLGSEFKNCDEVCTCGNDKVYSCAPRASDDIPDECRSTEEKNEAAETDFQAIVDEAEIKGSGLQNKFKKDSVDRLKKIKRRAMRLKNANRCEGQRKRRSARKARSICVGDVCLPDCIRLLELMDEAKDWMDDNLNNCQKETNKAANLKNQVDKIKTRLDKKCDKKML